MRQELAKVVQSRTRNVMITGSLFCLGMPIVLGVVAAHLDLRYDVLISAAVLLLLMPFLAGALIAFLGTLVPSECWDATEWGFIRPSKCFLVGWGPLLPFMLPAPYLLLVALGFWLLLIAGSAISARIYARLRGPGDGVP